MGGNKRPALKKTISYEYGGVGDDPPADITEDGIAQLIIENYDNIGLTYTQIASSMEAYWYIAMMELLMGNVIETALGKIVLRTSWWGAIDWDKLKVRSSLRPEPGKRVFIDIIPSPEIKKWINNYIRKGDAVSMRDLTKKKRRKITKNIKAREKYDRRNEITTGSASEVAMERPDVSE